MQMEKVQNKNIRTSYKTYKKATKKNGVDLRTYLDITNGLMKFLSAKLLEGDELLLPARMGIIKIIGTKRKLKFNDEGLLNMPPNWRKTKELWDNNPEAKAKRKIVYCLNEETSGVVYKVLWSPGVVYMDQKMKYSLKMTRENKRAISSAIKAGKEYFIKPNKVPCNRNFNM